MNRNLNFSLSKRLFDVATNMYRLCAGFHSIIACKTSIADTKFHTKLMTFSVMGKILYENRLCSGKIDKV